MCTYEEYYEILTLWEIHRNKKKIACITGIPRETVRDCIKKFGNVSGLEAQTLEDARIRGISALVESLEDPDDPDNVYQDYAYLLGLYLGDGCISKMNRVHRLRIALDKKYPEIIQSCVVVLERLFPDNQVGIVHRKGCVDVSLYHKHLPKIFPQ
ncbi:MAG: hypothetical protein AAFV98_22510, partial [Chloroflexota bacterium]